MPSDPTDVTFDGFVCSLDGALFATCDTDSPFLAGPFAEG